MFSRLVPMVAGLLLTACVITPTTPHPIDPSAQLSVPLSPGLALHYRQVGQQHATMPILLVHGIPDASDSWMAIAAQLGRTYPVYSVDLAGYGYSTTPETGDISLSAQADYLREFLDGLGLQQVTLVGHDIGGGVAQIFAVRNPRRTHRLVLINSVMDSHWPVLEMRMLRTPLLGYAALTMFERPLWWHMLRKGSAQADQVTPADVERYQHWYQGSDGRHKLIRNAQALDNADLTSIARQIRALPMPTAILWGREDRFLDATPAQELCLGMRDCTFTFIEQGGHFVLDEQPQAIADAIQKFLSSKP